MTYRAEHVGSLLRPPMLLKARGEHAAGRLPVDALRAAEDQAILEALAVQRAAGLDVYSDGEYRRLSFLSDMADAVDGFIDEQGVRTAWHGGGSAPDRRSTAKVVGGRLTPKRRLTEHEVPFLAGHAPGPYKMTVPDPVCFVQPSYRTGITDKHYPTRVALLDALVDIVHREMAALADDGVPYLQLDAPGLTAFVDERRRADMRDRGIDPGELLAASIAADRACLEALRQPGVTVGVHLCRGNSRGRWLAAGGYDAIAEQLFSVLPVDRFLLEYDSPRAGDFAPLRYVPEGVTVVLGLVTTKEGTLERVDDLARRIDEAAAYVPLDRLAISPQCGFASVAEGNLLSWDDQRRKLEVVAETAGLVWGT